MSSLKTEFREHFFFYEKHMGWIPLVVLFTMMSPLLMAEPFSDASMYEYANYSNRLDHTSLTVLAFAFLMLMTQSSIFLVSFLYACIVRFEISPYAEIKKLVSFWKIYSKFEKKYSSKEISNAASKLPKNSNENAKELVKKISHIRTKTKTN